MGYAAFSLPRALLLLSPPRNEPVDVVVVSVQKQADVLARPVWPEESMLVGFRGSCTSLEAGRGSTGTVIT